MARDLDRGLVIDGPMQADTALVPDRQNEFPFMEFDGPANVLVCPNLASANIAYKLLQRIAGAEMTGPILEGLSKPAHVLQRGDSGFHMSVSCFWNSENDGNFSKKSFENYYVIINLFNFVR